MDGQSNVNFLQVVEPTEEQRRAWYQKMKKSELVDMLLARDRYWEPKKMEPYVVEPNPDMCVDFSISSASTGDYEEEYDEDCSEAVWDSHAPWGPAYYSTSSVPGFELSQK